MTKRDILELICIAIGINFIISNVAGLLMSIPFLFEYNFEEGLYASYGYAFTSMGFFASGVGLILLRKFLSGNLIKNDKDISVNFSAVDLGDLMIKIISFYLILEAIPNLVYYLMSYNYQQSNQIEFTYKDSSGLVSEVAQLIVGLVTINNSKFVLTKLKLEKND